MVINIYIFQNLAFNILFLLHLHLPQGEYQSGIRVQCACFWSKLEMFHFYHKWIDPKGVETTETIVIIEKFSTNMKWVWVVSIPHLDESFISSVPKSSQN